MTLLSSKPPHTVLLGAGDPPGAAAIVPMKAMPPTMSSTNDAFWSAGIARLAKMAIAQQRRLMSAYAR